MENKVTADYLDKEGCLHCGICGKRKQMKVSLMGFEHVVSCLCECEVKARLLTWYYPIYDYPITKALIC